MRAMPLAMFVLFAVCGAMPVGAADTEGAKPKKPKMVCRADTNTGSRISRTSICATQAEWDALDRAREENTKSMLARMSTEAGNQPTVELMDPAEKARLMPGPGGGGGL